MLDKYFVEEIMFYKSSTPRLKKLRNFLSDYKYAILTDSNSFKALNKDLENKIKDLNEEYPRSHPLSLSLAKFLRKPGCWKWLYSISYLDEYNTVIVCSIAVKPINKIISSNQYENQERNRSPHPQN